MSTNSNGRQGWWKPPPPPSETYQRVAGPRYAGPGQLGNAAVWSGVPVPLWAQQGPWFALNTGQVQATEAATVPNAAALQYNTTNQTTGLIGSIDGGMVYLAGIDTQLDGGQMWMMWQAASLEAPGPTVYCPFANLGQPGRWVGILPETYTANINGMQTVASAGAFRVQAATNPVVYVIVAPSPVGAVQILLPVPAVTIPNQVFRVKDAIGMAASLPIAVMCEDLVTLTDSGVTYTMLEAWQAVDFFWNGTGYSVL